VVQNQTHRTSFVFPTYLKIYFLEKLQLGKHKTSMELFFISCFYDYRYVSPFVLDKLKI